MRALLLCLAACLLAGCDSFSPSDALPALPNATADLAVLQSADGWIVVAAVSGGEAIQFPSGAFPVYFSADGMLSGRIPPNAYTGEYTASEDGSLAVSDRFVSTLISESEESRRLGGILLQELSQATRFEIEGPTLQVRSADGDGVRLGRLSVQEAR
ncbi:MAG: META domain-containing protein [Bacteroidota bacterium]